MNFKNERCFFKNKEDWSKIANILDKKAVECALKFEVLKRFNVQHIKWSSVEDSVLCDIVRCAVNLNTSALRVFMHRKQNLNRIRWKDVTIEFYEKCDCSVMRNPKQCQSHWMTHLNGVHKRKKQDFYQFLFVNFLLHVDIPIKNKMKNFFDKIYIHISNFSICLIIIFKQGKLI